MSRADENIRMLTETSGLELTRDLAHGADDRVDALVVLDEVGAVLAEQGPFS